MPRPLKQGLDYFPLDTDFFTNKKTKRLRRAHDTIGILTYLNLLSRVYREGYFYRFDDLEEFSMDIAEEIANKQLRSVAAGVTETINYLVERGILDQGLFEKGVISGVALQEQYVISTYKAKRKIKMDVHLLVDVDEVISEFKKNSEETPINSEKTEVNSEESTQSKVNKSKTKNKEKEKQNSLNAGENTPAPEENDKKIFGCFENVEMSVEDRERLTSMFGETVASELVDNLSRKLKSKGYKYEDHYATILIWAQKDGVKPITEASGSFDTNEFFELALARSFKK